MIISEKLTLSIKTNMCQSIQSYLVDLKQSLLFLEEDILKVYKHKTLKKKKKLVLLVSQKIRIFIFVRNYNDAVKTL